MVGLVPLRPQGWQSRHERRRGAVQTTRQAILNLLRRYRDATVRSLGDSLGLTPSAIRQQLGLLERDGLITVRRKRGAIGRPAYVYSLSPEGDAVFPNRYDDLSNSLINEIRALTGSQGLQTVLLRVAARIAEPYEPRVLGKDLAIRVAEAAAVINERGGLAEVQVNTAGDFLISQYACLFPKVAQSNDDLCALELEIVRRLCGGDACLVRCLRRGNKSCTFRIRPAAAWHHR